GIARVRKKSPRLYASAWSGRRTALAAKVRHDNRVHLIVPFPSLMHCFRCAALVVEADAPLGRPRQIGHDEADTRVQLAKNATRPLPRRGVACSRFAPDS